MCGIVGLFGKSPAITESLGAHLAEMLVQLGDRGPDSAGVAVYRDPAPAGSCKVSLFAADPAVDWAAVAAGLPRDVVRRFALEDMKGSHALGHTRMATESRVTTQASHPFSTGLDLCLVHNGSLSNHNALRRELRREGVEFQTDNDTEVAAGYLTWRLREGDSIEVALEGCLRDLDGFYTFAVGTADGFSVLRDPIACKPAVLAETDDWVAMASEYRAIAVLPGAEDAVVWEPAPARVYSWALEPV